MYRPKQIILLGIFAFALGVATSASAGTIIQPGELVILGASENLVVDGAITISANATLNASASTTSINFSGNWTNSGYFSAGDGTVTLTASSTLTGATSFYNFTNNTASTGMTFVAGQTQTISNTLTLNGQATGTEVQLRSTTSGTRFTLGVTGGGQRVDYVDVKDSNASSNNIIAANSINSGNNDDTEAPPHWVFGAPSITYPETGNTLGPQPTVIGTSGVSDTVNLLLSSDNSTLATVTADTSGKFIVKQSDFITSISSSDSLVPATSGVKGTARSFTYSASPTTNQVPTIVSPIDDERVRGATPTITGKGLASQTSDLYALDSAGNLLLTNVASSTVGGDGDYSITSANYTTNLVKGTIYLTVVVNGVASLITNVSMVDPYGVAFDSESDSLINGAVVTIYGETGTILVPGGAPTPAGCAIGIGDTNPVTVGADGFYSYLCSTANGYRITVSAEGYDYPSTKDTFPAGRTVITGSKGESFNIGTTIVEMDQPMDSNMTLLKLEKKSNKKEASVGDIVTYTVYIENLTNADVAGVYIEDRIPPGFKYLKGKAIYQKNVIADPSGTRPISFDIGTVAASSKTTLKYQLVVGSGVTFGNYENTVHARYSSGRTISNQATNTVKVVPDPLFDLGTIIGKVYWDVNKNGIQDEPFGGMVERGVGSARVAMEDGTFITTDSDGKFHIPSIQPGMHIFRIDERSLPQDVIITTRREHIVHITPGLLAKVNFGIAYWDDKKMKDLATKEKIPIEIVQDSESIKPRLNVSLFNPPLIISNAWLKYPAEFRIFTNYSLFINKWVIEIFDKAINTLVEKIEGTRDSIFDPILWDGIDQDGELIKSDRIYSYKLTVFGDGNRFDTTKPREFKVVLEKEPEEYDPFEDTVEKEKERMEANRDWIIAENKVNVLEKQNIILDGEMVQVYSPKTLINNLTIKKDRQVVEQIALEHKQLTAKDLLESPQQEVFDKGLPVADIIIPKGEYTIQVNGSATGEQIATGEAAGIAAGEESDSGYNLWLAEKDVQPSQAVSYEKTIKVGDDYFFLVGMGNLEFGQTDTKGNIEPVQQEDRYRGGLWVDGKLAYYLKAKIKGKYLITSSLDTEREQKELFKQIDPNKYYPIYGDASELNYEANDTQGPFYLLVEWDKSELKWGNYDTSFNDTELSTYERTLYGGKLYYESLSTSQFGDPDTKIVVFGATAKQMAAHNEFVGTGGSLYYLKHKHIIEGSDKIEIQVRDKINGLVLASIEQKRGSDYYINYDEGRILFWKPVSFIADYSTIISAHLLDGNKVYVVADYEYETRDKYDEASRGARISQHVTDYARLGATYVKEEKNQENFELKGYDATVHVGKDGIIEAEYAETQSDQMNNFISTDGGISFTQISTDEFNNGKAISVKAEIPLFGSMDVGTYYQKIEKGFSTAGTVADQGTEKMGVRSTFKLWDNTGLNLWHDIQRLLDDGNEQAEVQVGAQETQTSTAQLFHHADKFDITAEYRRNRTTDVVDGVDAETNQNTDIVAARVDYRPKDNLGLFAEQQVTVVGGNDKQTTLGADYRMNEELTIRGRQIFGTQGTAFTIGGDYNVDFFGGITLKGYQTFGADGLDSSVSVGADVDLNENIKLSASQTIGAASSVGANINLLNDRVTANLTHEFDEDGYVTNLGATAKIDEKTSVTGNIAQTPDAKITSVTGNLQVDKDTEAYGTISQEDSIAGGKKDVFIYGTKHKLDKGIEIRSERSFIKSDKDVETATTYGISRDHEGKKFDASLTRKISNTDTGGANTNILGLTGEINDKFAMTANIEKGTVNNLDKTQTERYAAAIAASYVDQDKLKASLKLEGRLDEGQEKSRQILGYWAIEGKVTQDLSLFNKANISLTQNLTTDDTQGRYKEIVSGFAYRPLYFDRLNLLGKYTFLEDDSPPEQEDFEDVEKTRSHIFGLEGIYDLHERYQFVGKIAFKQLEEKVLDFEDYTRTQTWLGILRLNHRFFSDYEMGVEYRMLSQIQADDYKQGFLLELSRYFGDWLKVGVGYDFTGFTDDLANDNYSTYGWFVRMTTSLGEVAHVLMRTRDEKIKDFKAKSLRKMAEIMRLPEAQMQIEEVKFYRDQAKYWMSMGEYGEANNCLQRGIETAEQIHQGKLKAEAEKLALLNKIKIDELINLNEEINNLKKMELAEIAEIPEWDEKLFRTLQLFYKTGKMYFKAEQYRKALDEWKMGLELLSDLGINYEKIAEEK